jgi:hypothetical protein
LDPNHVLAAPKFGDKLSESLLSLLLSSRSGAATTSWENKHASRSGTFIFGVGLPRKKTNPGLDVFFTFVLADPSNHGLHFAFLDHPFGCSVTSVCQNNIRVDEEEGIDALFFIMRVDSSGIFCPGLVDQSHFKLS